MKHAATLLALVVPLASCAGTDDFATEGIELGKSTQALTGTNLYYGGTHIGATGWRSNGWDPDICDPNSSWTCGVPWLEDLCFHNVNSLGVGFPNPVGAAADALEEAGWDGSQANAGSNDPSYCPTWWPDRMPIKVQTGSFQSFDWSNSNGVWMKRVVRIACTNWGNWLSESYTANWRFCKAYEITVDRTRLDEWVDYHGVNRGWTYARVMSYAVGVALGIGESGLFWDAANHALMPNEYNHYEFDGFSSFIVESMDPYGSTVDLTTTVIY